MHSLTSRATSRRYGRVGRVLKRAAAPPVDGSKPVKPPNRQSVMQRLKFGLIINMVGFFFTLTGLQATVGLLVAKTLVRAKNAQQNLLHAIESAARVHACMRVCMCACVCVCVCVCVLMILLKGDLHPMQTDGGPKQNAAQDTPLTPLPKRARICRRQSLRIPSSPARLRRSTPSWRWTSFLCRRLPTCFSHISRAWHSHSFCFASAPPLRPRRPRRRRGRGSLR